ncbi:hypothetical protein SAMD00079811_08380 [Scytonema sp. HK-05]|nr:hypothetical protein SAMD00079811_08380 [Scytonema sp. HK-05]
MKGLLPLFLRNSLGFFRACVRYVGYKLSLF